jgi:hypothetical protein
VTIIRPYLLAFVALSGVVVYAAAAPSKPVEVGRIVFFCGLLSLLLWFAIG